MIGYHPRVPMIEAAFQRFSETAVDLGASATESGRGIARSVIQIIEDGSRAANGCPVLLREDSFIAGSFGRRTQEQPLDDIDIYLVMDAPGVRAAWNGMLLPLRAHFRENVTPLVADPTLAVDGEIDANAVLGRFADCLRSWFPKYTTSVRPKRKNCFIDLGGLNIDLTPVTWYSPISVGIDQYWMPAGGGQPHWKATNPKMDQRNLSYANQVHNGELLKVIRMMKWWNANRNADRIKGIHLETLIIQLLENQPLDGWAKTLHYLFANLKLAVQMPCADPTGLGAPLDSTLSAESRIESVKAIERASIFARRAHELASAGYLTLALEKWRVLFPLTD